MSVCVSNGSLLVDVDHAECGSLVGLALVVDSEEHHFVPWEAVPLLLCHFQDEGDQLFLVLFYKKRGTPLGTTQEGVK